MCQVQWSGLGGSTNDSRMSQGRELVVKRGPGRPPRHSAAFVAAKFAFKTGDLVLVKWNDGMVYFAKIKRIDHKRHKCVVVFDDKSQDEAHFSQIHSGKGIKTNVYGLCVHVVEKPADVPHTLSPVRVSQQRQGG